jgi:hypothetical protein
MSDEHDRYQRSGSPGMNATTVALRAYVAGMIHAGAGPDKFSALCEDIAGDPFMACQLADFTADIEDEQGWTDASHAWRLFGHRGCGLPDTEASPAARAAAEYIGRMVEGLS